MNRLMIISKPHLQTHLKVWAPKYSAKWGDYGEKVALLHKDKVDHATPKIIIEFTKAKDLAGQRFSIERQVAQEHKIGNNGSALMYIVPFSHLSPWQSSAEIYDEIEAIWPKKEHIRHEPLQQTSRDQG